MPIHLMNAFLVRKVEQVLKEISEGKFYGNDPISKEVASQDQQVVVYFSDLPEVQFLWEKCFGTMGSLRFNVENQTAKVSIMGCTDTDDGYEDVTEIVSFELWKQYWNSFIQHWKSRFSTAHNKSTVN